MICNFSSIDFLILERLRRDAKLIPDHIYSETNDSFDIDKSWHGIHFLLAGKVWEHTQDPISWAVLGGTEFGEDVGYGPTRYLTPDQVKKISTAFEAVGETQFRSRFSPKEMEKLEIYPTIWERDGLEALEYLVEYYNKLVSFYRSAADRSEGVLIWLN